MNRRSTVCSILVAVLAASLSLGVVSAARPTTPMANYRVTIWSSNSDLTMYGAVEGPGYADRWYPGDIYDARGRPLDHADWAARNVGFSTFTMTIPPEWYDGEQVEVVGIEHNRWHFDIITNKFEVDKWFLMLSWYKDYDNDGTEEEFILSAFMKDDPAEEGTFNQNENSWTVAFTSLNEQIVKVSYAERVSAGKRQQYQLYTAWTGYLDFTLKVERLS